MHPNDITIDCREKMAILAKFCKIQLVEGVNATLKKVDLYLQNDSYLISNSPYTINYYLLANKSLDKVL